MVAALPCDRATIAERPRQRLGRAGLGVLVASTLAWRRPGLQSARRRTSCGRRYAGAELQPVLAALRGEGAERLFRLVGDARGRLRAAPRRCRAGATSSRKKVSRSRRRSRAKPRGSIISNRSRCQEYLPSNNPMRIGLGTPAAFHKPGRCRSHHAVAIGAVVIAACRSSMARKSRKATTRKPARSASRTSHILPVLPAVPEANPCTMTIVSASVAGDLIGDADAGLGSWRSFVWRDSQRRRVLSIMRGRPEGSLYDFL